MTTLTLVVPPKVAVDAIPAIRRPPVVVAPSRNVIVPVGGAMAVPVTVAIT